MRANIIICLLVLRMDREEEKEKRQETLTLLLYSFLTRYTLNAFIMNMLAYKLINQHRSVTSRFITLHALVASASAVLSAYVKQPQ